MNAITIICVWGKLRLALQGGAVPCHELMFPLRSYALDCLSRIGYVTGVGGRGLDGLDRLEDKRVGQIKKAFLMHLAVRA